MSPLRVLRLVHLDSRGFPTRRDSVGVVHEQVRTRMAVFIEVRRDTEMNLDIVGERESVATAPVSTRGEPKGGVVREGHVKIAHGEDRRDPLEFAHDGPRYDAGPAGTSVMARPKHRSVDSR